MNAQRTVRTLAVVALIALLGLSLDAWAFSPEGAELADELEGSGGRSGGGLVLFGALALMIVLGAPLFVIIGVLAAICFAMYGEPSLYDAGK